MELLPKRKAKRKRSMALWIVPAAVLAVAGIAYAAMMWMMSPPDDLDLALSKASADGRYVTTIEAGLDPLAVGPMHSWTIEVKTIDGRPVDDASVTIDGGMPQHGHGLPTQPQVTQALGNGRYLLEGMKFNMPGWWTLTVKVDGPDGRDETTFNLVL